MVQATIPAACTMALWFLSSFPSAPEGATGAPIEYSVAGMIGHGLAKAFAPQCLSTLAAVKRETGGWAMGAGWSWRRRSAR